MHRALLIPEVLLGIFAHINEIVYLSSDDSQAARKESFPRQSLASLATTCKTFHEPAMDLLWANIDELKPLLGCVTRLHQMIYSNGARFFRSEGVEPLSEHEARQFLRHASRVRSIHISSDEHFSLLTVLPTETCMFPRLISLSWQIEAADNRYLHLFLSRTLRECRIAAVHPALRSIGTRCASLEGLVIGDPDESTADEPSLLAEIVHSCTRLKYLSCSQLEWAVWSHLSNLPTLLNLEIYSGCWPVDRHDLKFAPFLNVTVLHFCMDTAAYTITALQLSEFPSLTHFAMYARNVSQAEAEQLFCALSQCKACQTLEHIIIHSIDADRLDPSDNSLTAITQFFCFTQLRSLCLIFDNFPIYLDNDLLLEAMSSWPHIYSMKLKDYQLDPPAVTFRGLFAALRLCPHLQTLQLHIDAVNIDIDPDNESFQHTSLQSLNVGYSDIEDAEAAARIIFSMLPCVDQVGHAAWQEWHDVNEFLKSFRSSAVPGRHLTPEPAPAT
ncbi:hypothetical protein EDB19DRAFT_1904167 [Suillus lakei]|nr:hypothetical protein EDB19DRAFT_1904167 [Suillus lakei]